jgi:hypothetical protein
VAAPIHFPFVMLLGKSAFQNPILLDGPSRNMKGADQCTYYTYTYGRAFHGATILKGGCYHFLEAFHGATIVARHPDRVEQTID